jgi:predicted MFS family arabinose efflux permease
MSAWAPLIPYITARMSLEPAELGVILLCLGFGSIVAMPITGMLASRFGCRPVIMLSGLLACVVLPLLAIAPNPLLLAIAVFLFGAALGTLDVSMNVQAVIVERDSGTALMSGFHALYSLGGIAGAGGMALLLSTGLSALLGSSTVAAVACGALVVASPNLLRAPKAPVNAGPLLVVPHGAVIYIAVLCFVAFLAEGAVLDWSALLLTNDGRFSARLGGLGYAVFAVAMTVGRLTGDRVVGRWGGRRVLLFGGVCAAGGFVISVLSPSPGVALLGFLLIGIGAANIVPVLFTAVGSQRDMPASAAVGAITTIGYAGVLAGPALIGFVAHATSLGFAFAGLSCLMLLVAASARLASSPGSPS